MKYNQQAIDDLLSPLRYVNLKDIDPNSINRIGQGVFPELTTLDHLSILDLVTKAYQAVHLPTLGNCIPQSTVLTNTVITDSQDSKVLITAAANEVIEICGLAVKTVTSYEFGSANYLAFSNSGDTQKIMDLSRLEDICAAGSGMFYGTTMYDPGTNGGVAQHITPRKLLLNGGDSLVMVLETPPNQACTIEITYRKVVQ